MEFNKVTLDTVSIMNEFLQYKRDRLCDCTVGGTVMWREFFETEYAIEEEALFFKVKYLDGSTAFTFPLAADYKKALMNLKNYCRQNQIPMKMCSVSKENLEIIKELFDVEKEETNRDWFDYLYKAEDFRTFAGRKYSGQRNHINAFRKNYPDYTYEEIHDGNMEQVKQFMEKFTYYKDKEGNTADEEIRKTKEVLDYYHQYGMKGIVLYAGGNIVGITIGEMIKDTLFVHIEKADIAYRGSYQVLSNQFAKCNLEAMYINREEDVGDMGLRTSKLSYHPVELLEKYNVEIRD